MIFNVWAPFASDTPAAVCGDQKPDGSSSCSSLHTFDISDCEFDRCGNIVEDRLGYGQPLKALVKMSAAGTKFALIVANYQSDRCVRF